MSSPWRSACSSSSPPAAPKSARCNARGEANEIILLNSHDGTSSYQMLAGMFRFVCSNGLVCGDTVADVRDGALSGSTLKEASSWGKVSTALEQMVYGECTTLIPLIIGYGYHKGAWKKRKAANYAKFLQDEDAKVAALKAKKAKK